MSKQLDHFDTDLQCEDAEFVENNVEYDSYSEFITCQEEQDEFNEMEKERRKEEYRAQLDTNNTGDEPNWRDYV